MKLHVAVACTTLLGLGACGEVTTGGIDAPVGSPDAPVGAPDADESAIDADPRPPDAAPPDGIHVDDTGGDDTNPGTSAQPVRTVTRGLELAATSGETTVLVAPGRYDAEAFPLVIPDGVALIGDEATKGADTILIGVVDGFTRGIVEPGIGSTVAGFTIENQSTMTIGPMNVVLDKDAAIVRNNRILSAPDSGIYARGGAGRIIEDNIITGATWSGIAFVGQADTNDRLARNTITGNQYGVSLDVAGADLGGGAGGSAGGNILSCNTARDVSGSPVSAHNNRWDHVPPTTGSVAGADHSGNADTTGATLAPSPCP
jgi:hypothetical protein